MSFLNIMRDILPNTNLALISGVTQGYYLLLLPLFIYLVYRV